MVKKMEEQGKPLEEISAYQGRQRWGSLLEEVFYQGKRFAIKRRNKRMAVLMPVEEYEYLVGLKSGEQHTS